MMIAPWLSIDNCPQAISFYKSAFNAVETYRLETPDGGLIVRLSIAGADIWISGNNKNDPSDLSQPLSGDTIRLILTTSEPDLLFDNALKAGATQVFPVSEAHGWRLGRLIDPFGLHWEIGHPLSNH